MGYYAEPDDQGEAVLFEEIKPLLDRLEVFLSCMGREPIAGKYTLSDTGHFQLLEEEFGKLMKQ